jgi:hypothetical protein
VVVGTGSSVTAGADEAKFDLLLDYASNAAFYPMIQAYFPEASASAAGNLGQE